MIPERFMVTAKRLDNGETVTGYVIMMPNTTTVKIMKHCKSYPRRAGKEQEFDVYDIIPETVELVAVKVEHLDKCGSCFNKPVYCGDCPNCGHTVASSKNYPYELNANDYCGACGQRLDWSDNK